jgi:hypothetical protein
MPIGAKAAESLSAWLWASRRQRVERTRLPLVRLVQCGLHLEEQRPELLRVIGAAGCGTADQRAGDDVAGLRLSRSKGQRATSRGRAGRRACGRWEGIWAGGKLHACGPRFVQQRVERRLLALDGHLPFKQGGELFLDARRPHGMMAGQAVELGAQRRDAILVGILHCHLARDGTAEQVVAIDQIGGGANVGGQEENGPAERRSSQPGPDPVNARLAVAGHRNGRGRLARGAGLSLLARMHHGRIRRSRNPEHESSRLMNPSPA